MTKRFLVVMTMFLAVAMLVSAADVSGKWTAQVPGRNDQVRPVNFDFKVDGDKLTGTVSGGQGQPAPIADGKISGDNISFSVTMERGGNTVKQTYTGKVSGNEIQMKREGGQGQAREFVAKRAQ